MNALTEGGTRQPETQLTIATEDEEGPEKDPDDPDEFLPELPLDEEAREETSRETEPATTEDDQAAFDALAALSARSSDDVPKRRPDHFLLHLVVQEIVVLGVLALAVLALAHFKVGPFPLLVEEIGKGLRADLPASLKVRTAASAPQRARAPATPAAETVPGSAHRVVLGTRTPDRAAKGLDAPPPVLPDRFGLFVEDGDDLAQLPERECFAGLGNASALPNLVAHIKASSMSLRRARRSRPTLLLHSRVTEPERLRLFDVDTFERRDGISFFDRRSVAVGPIRDHPHLYRIEVPYDLVPGTYALGIMGGYTDAGTHWFWPFRVE